MTDSLLEKNKTVQAVKRAFALGKAPHAYVVQAEQTLLNEALTLLSAAAVCGKGGCGVCLNCAEALGRRHPDVFYYPMNGRKTVSVEDVKNIVENSMTKPTVAKSKAYVLNASVKSAAQNWQGKLLKILEEPPENNYFFIGVTNASDLLDTVLSRASVIDIAKLRFEDVKEYLVGEGYGARSAEICALLCDGSLASALELISNGEAEKIYETVADALKNMTSTRVSLPYVAAMAEYKDSYKLLLTALEQLFSETVGFYDGITLLKETDDVTIIAENYSREAALRCIELVENAYKELAAFANFNMVFDNLILKILEVRYICPK